MRKLCGATLGFDLRGVTRAVLSKLLLELRELDLSRFEFRQRRGAFVLAMVK